MKRRLHDLAEFVWSSPSALARSLRLSTSPLAWLFGFVVRRRNRQFDAQRASMRPTAIPAISIGNLTVGGTGKTPVASWFVSQLRVRGGTPAIVLRGYGDDEWRVHGLLAPGVSVVVAPDRSVGLVTAQSQRCDIGVLDDAFQHRRTARIADIVLVSADAWTGEVRLLPSGPYREPLASLQRATVVVITVKAASPATVAGLRTAIVQAAPGVPVALVRLSLGRFRLAAAIGAGDRRGGPAGLDHELGWIHGREAVLISAVANPGAFRAQMEALGATVVQHATFPDHYDFAESDVTRILERVPPSAVMVCTLKDAVKLAPLWPRAGAALWYVSQNVLVEQGAEILDQVMVRALAARRTFIPTAG